ncbi:hypothetical protein GS582_35730 [Rhodococcus hoagii]|nr:hypothetical protein [Prescottella equi]
METVQFRDGASAIANPVAVIDGFAKLTHVFDATGAHSITATFHGTGAYTASNSDAQDVTWRSLRSRTSRRPPSWCCPWCSSGNAGQPLGARGRPTDPARHRAVLRRRQADRRGSRSRRRAGESYAFLQWNGVAHDRCEVQRCRGIHRIVLDRGSARDR